MFFGNLNEFANIIKGKQPVPKRLNPSLSDSEIKLSEDISQSEFSQRHERRRSGYLKNDGRNHMIDDHRFHLISKDKHKTSDKLNLSKDGEKMNDRLSKLEILQDKDQSFSTKGPILAKTEQQPFLGTDESFEDLKSKTGRKSEIIPKHSLDAELEDDKEFKDSELKDFLKDKIAESQNLNDIEKPEQKSQSQDYDELVAFPSDDEASKKLKDEVINDINSVESDTDEHPESPKIIAKEKSIQEIVPEPAKNIEESKIEIIENEKPKDKIQETTKSIQKSENDEWPSGFPSIAERTQTLEDQKTDRKTSPNFDLLGDILKDEQNEKDLVFNEDVLEAASKEDDVVKSYEEEDMDDLFASSKGHSEIDGREILLQSNKSNLRPIRNDKTEEYHKLEETPGFSDKDLEKNRSFQATELEEDKVPEKPTTALDVEGIPKIEHVPESIDSDDSKFYHF